MTKTKAFTLFEIIISIILISIIYTFTINSFSKKNNNFNNISLLNLKQHLLKYDFEENITIKCIEEDFSCFVFIDDILQEEKILNLFVSKPTIYKYNNNLEQIEFLPVDFEKLESFDIIFKYSCNKEQKCSEFIVEIEDDKSYIFNDIKNKPDTINYINDIDIYFDNNINEVKDAF